MKNNIRKRIISNGKFLIVKDGTPNYINENKYAMNRALHYTGAIINYTSSNALADRGVFFAKTQTSKLNMDIIFLI